MQRHFSKETRAKLSAAAKARWAERRAAASGQTVIVDMPAPLTALYAAAIALTGDYEGIKEAMVDCATGETIINALSEERSAGTSLQDKLRKVLTDRITEALE